jgi:hypothetical protein
MTLGGKKIVKLPHGYVSNGTCADEVEIRAMLGVEEDILSDDKLPMGVRLNEMISNCLVRVGTETDKAKIKDMVPKMSTEDQTVLLVALRSISVSDTYAIETECPNCEAKIQMDLALSSLGVKQAVAKGTMLEVSLPSGRKAKIRPMTIEDSMKTADMRLQGDSRLSTAILARTVELDGQAPTVESIKNLLYGDRVALRNMFDEMEGGIESNFDVKCPQCKKPFKDTLDIARAEFFSPKTI